MRRMPKLDHLAIVVRDWRAARDWYVSVLGFRVEFEVPERATAALQDDAGFTLFVAEDPVGPAPTGSCVLTVQVDDVDATYVRLAARGVAFAKPPQKLFWGYGAELLDPSGYRIGLWDETSMRSKGGS